MNILFRADSSSFIGTGHIMRDLVLAEEFKDTNIIFATQNLPGNINHKIEEKDYTVEILNSNNIEEVIDIIEKYSIDMIVIDCYDIDYDYEKELKDKTGIKLFVLDDTYEKHYCDILLNQNVYADMTKYESLIPENCELRCGVYYALLRDEFNIEKQKGRQNKKNINQLDVFIAMGGADHSNINTKILEVLKEFPNIHAHVVSTNANKYLEELEKYANDVKKVTLHINTNEIAKLMNKADFAIITPSVTLNEIFYLNVPFVAIKTAVNQNYMYEYLINNDFYVLEKFDVNLLKKNIKSLIQDLT